MNTHRLIDIKLAVNSALIKRYRCSLCHTDHVPDKDGWMIGVLYWIGQNRVRICRECIYELAALYKSPAFSRVLKQKRRESKLNRLMGKLKALAVWSSQVYKNMKGGKKK